MFVKQITILHYILENTDKSQVKAVSKRAMKIQKMPGKRQAALLVPCLLPALLFRDHHI